MFLRESSTKSDRGYRLGEWVISTGLKKGVVRYIQALNGDWPTKPIARGILSTVAILWVLLTIVALVASIVVLITGSTLIGVILLASSLLSGFRLRTVTKGRAKRVAKLRQKLGDDRFVSMTNPHGVATLFVIHQRAMQKDPSSGSLYEWCILMSGDLDTRELVNDYLTSTTLARNLLATSTKNSTGRPSKYESDLWEVVLDEAKSYAALIIERQRALGLRGSQVGLEDPEIWKLNADAVLAAKASMSKLTR